MRTIGRDPGIDFSIQVFTDASAALGIVRRRGLGRIRHLDVTDLWLQEQVRNRNKELEILKVAGAENMADLLAKKLGRPDMTKHLTNMNIFPGDSRPSAAPLFIMSPTFDIADLFMPRMPRSILTCSTGMGCMPHGLLLLRQDSHMTHWMGCMPQSLIVLRHSLHSWSRG